MTRYAELLAAPGLPRLEARMLLEHASGRPHSWLIAHDDEPVAAQVTRRFESLRERRLAGEPIAYLVGAREFYGRRFEVAHDVLIPRPETELLVDWSLETVSARHGARVLDLGTGSGCIAISLALERPDLRVSAIDRSAAALAVAARNAATLAASVEFRNGDWFEPIGPDERFDVIVSNPPYVAATDPHLERGDLRHEPRDALAAGSDGLDALRSIVQAAPAFLAPGGALIVEHGWNQAAAVRELMRAAGLPDPVTRRDLAGIERATCGRRLQRPMESAR